MSSFTVHWFQGKVFSDSESIQARAEAVMLLKQLNFPVCISSSSASHSYEHISVLHIFPHRVSASLVVCGSFFFFLVSVFTITESDIYHLRTCRLWMGIEICDDDLYSLMF